MLVQFNASLQRAKRKASLTTLEVDGASFTERQCNSDQMATSAVGVGESNNLREKGVVYFFHHPGGALSSRNISQVSIDSEDETWSALEQENHFLYYLACNKGCIGHRRGPISTPL